MNKVKTKCINCGKSLVTDKKYCLFCNAFYNNDPIDIGDMDGARAQGDDSNQQKDKKMVHVEKMEIMVSSQTQQDYLSLASEDLNRARVLLMATGNHAEEVHWLANKVMVLRGEMRLHAAVLEKAAE